MECDALSVGPEDHSLTKGLNSSRGLDGYISLRGIKEVQGSSLFSVQSYHLRQQSDQLKGNLVQSNNAIKG